MELLKKLIQFAMGNGIVMILGFISSPIITRVIDTTNLGKFGMFNTSVNLLMIITMLGVDQAYVRYYYEEPEENRAKLLRVCYRIAMVVGLSVSSIIMIFYRQVSNFIVNKESFTVAILLIIFVNISVMSRFNLLQVRMKQKAKLYSFLNIMVKFGYIIGIGIFYFIFGNSYMTLMISIIFGTLFSLIIGVVLERQVWFAKCKFVNLKTEYEQLIKYGMPFVFSMATTWLFQSIDRVTIKQFSGYSEVGLYTGAITIITLLNSFQTAFNTFWTPVSYERYAKDPENKNFFVRINKIVSVVMLMVAIGLILLKDVIILILGPNYRDAMFIFPYLVFMPIMSCISETTVVGINFKKKSKSHIYIAVISALFNLCGNLILVPRYGATGAAISTGLSYIVFFLVRTAIASKYYKVNYPIGKFFICVASIYILAAYSSFNRFNIIILILSVISISLIVILYKDVFDEFKKGLKPFLKLGGR